MAVAPGRPRQMERQPSERWSLCEGEEARARDGRRRFGRRRGALGSRGVELERPGCAAAAGRGSPRDDRINAGTVQWAGPARSRIGLSFVSLIEFRVPITRKLSCNFFEKVIYGVFFLFPFVFVASLF